MKIKIKTHQRQTHTFAYDKNLCKTQPRKFIYLSVHYSSPVYRSHFPRNQTETDTQYPKKKIKKETQKEKRNENNLQEKIRDCLEKEREGMVVVKGKVREQKKFKRSEEGETERRGFRWLLNTLNEVVVELIFRWWLANQSIFLN